jgi:hypothetical protein
MFMMMPPCAQERTLAAGQGQQGQHCVHQMKAASCLTAQEKRVGLPVLQGLVVLVPPPEHQLVLTRAVPYQQVWLARRSQELGPSHCLKAQAV